MEWRNVKSGPTRLDLKLGLFCTVADSNYYQQARCVYTMCLF